MRPSERELLRRLAIVVEGKAMICPKVRLTDILAITNATRHMDDVVAIDRKSVDFLLCETTTMLPCVAIHLSSDGRSSGGHRIGPVERAILAASLPLVEIADTDCTVDALRESIDPLLVQPVAVERRARAEPES